MKKFSIYFLFCLIVPNLIAQSSIKRIEGSPYPLTATPDRLFTTSETVYSYSQKIAVQSLQGILAKTKPEILRDTYGHKALLKSQGFTIDETYSSNFPGLLRKFSGRLAGYILCTAKESSVNVALSLSGILNAVAIPADIESTAKAAGLSMLLDVRGKDETWLYTNYGTQFSKTIASYQNCSDDRALFLGDYSAFAGAMQFWSDSPTSVLSNNVFNTLNSHGAVLGWGPGEGNTVEALSRKSLVIHPADFAPNLSTLTNIPIEKFEQKEPATPFKVVENVHTVCFVMSDGDNVQWLLGASDDKGTWANPNRGYMNVGWTISPALAELAPPMYKKYIDNAPTSVDGRNYLIAAPSGRGYFNPRIFPDLTAECVLQNKYMKKADLRIANIIDVDGAQSNVQSYLSQSNIDALFYYNYSNYAKLSGSLNWYKNKPSIAAKYTLWTGETGLINDMLPTSLAAELNKLSTNIKSQTSYSLISVIVWSNNVEAVLKCIGQLGPNVRVVAPDEFVWLLRKNLKNLPVGTGNGLKGEYYSGINFDTFNYSKIDRVVDFDWGTGSPDTSILGKEAFSIRWSGQIQPLYSESYTFYASADGGSKLTVNGTVIFDAHSTDGLNTQSGTIALTAGQKYDISLEYAEQSGNASCNLEWSSISELRQIVPKIQLYTEPIRVASSTGVLTAYADADFGGFSAGLKIGDYTLADLNSFGIYDNDVASLKVGMGYKVILYEKDNFGGQSMEITSDNANLGDFIDKASSIKVKANGDPNLEGIYFLQNRASGFNMDIVGGVGSLGDGAYVQQFTAAKTLNQQFRLTHLGDGCYSIMAMHSNKVLDVTGHSKFNGIGLQQWTYYKSDNQQFILISTGDGFYKIVPKHSGKIIEAASLSLESRIRQMSDANQTKGQWQFNAVPPLPNGSGNGLDAAYYNGSNYTLFRHSQIDTTINFNWGTVAPNVWVGADNFSVKWTGKIQPRTSGTYTFYIKSDNGRRLYINNQLIIDKWISDAGIEYSGTINLVKGQFYPIEVDYYEENGGASCKLEWSSPEQPREVVPKSQFYSASNGLDKTEYSDTDVNIYPLPVRNKMMNIELTGLNELEETTLTIFNLVGKTVLQTQIRQSNKIDLKTLQAGSYIVSVQNKNFRVNKNIIVL